MRKTGSAPPRSDRTLAGAFIRQAFYCRALNGAFTAFVLEQLADRLSDPPLAAILAGYEGEAALRDGLALRLAAAIHYGALAGFASEGLRALYARAEDNADFWPEAAKFLAVHEGFVKSYLHAPPQTNEVMRAAALLGGFLEAGRFGLPLALCELGASAGLNLYWDRFYYRAAGFCWGEETSPVVLPLDWQGGRPRLDAALRIGRREGCDAAVLDPSSREARWRLQSYIWPEQKDRLARQRAAIALAAAGGYRVEQADALAFCARALKNHRAGEVLVIYHSVFWQYLERAKQQKLAALIEKGGQRGLPLVWLSMEPQKGADRMEVRWRVWRNGVKEEKVLAHAGAHGRPIVWLQ